MSAPLASTANYLSGYLSDHVGRKGPIVCGFFGAAVTVITLALIQGHLATAFGLIILLGIVGAPAYSLDRVLVADAIPAGEKRESAYGAVRIVGNLGALLGPPVGALLIYLGGWTAFLLGTAGGGVIGALLALAFLPAAAAQKARRDAEGRVLSVVLSDRPFVLLLASTLFGFLVYAGYEAVLPVIAVSSYGLSAATWGLLVVIGPILVIIGQLRVIRVASRLRATSRLGLAMLLMGLPFLLLVASSAVGVIAAVVVVFVIGEMLWVPTSQNLAADLAPEQARGTYFGAMAAMTGPAWTIGPFVSLQLRDAAGVSMVWVFFAGAAAAGALVGIAAARSAGAAMLAQTKSSCLAAAGIESSPSHYEQGPSKGS
jgi:MFS family permease